MNLSDELKHFIPDVDLKQARAIIRVYDRWVFLNRNNYCAVCDKALTKEEQDAVTENDFNVCCEKHAEYRIVFQLGRIRTRLGYGFTKRHYL